MSRKPVGYKEATVLLGKRKYDDSTSFIANLGKVALQQIVH